jgi:hypothetical protein
MLVAWKWHERKPEIFSAKNMDILIYNTKVRVHYLSNCDYKLRNGTVKVSKLHAKSTPLSMSNSTPSIFAIIAMMNIVLPSSLATF